MCRQCDDKLFVTLNALNKHVRAHHCETRDLTNLQLVQEALFDDLKDNCTSEWPDALDFLRSLRLTPPPFQQPLTTKVKYRLEQDLCETFLKTIKISNEALKPPTHPKSTKKSEYQPWELLLLPILFEQLVLFPEVPTKNPKKRPSLSYTLRDRLLRFKQGRLRELYDESRQVRSKTPKEQATKPVSVQKSAQVAADLDNFKSANARITKHAPVALINDTNLHVLQGLHPPSLGRGCCKPRTSTRSGGTRRKLQVTPKKILDILSHLNRGKATGVHCDSLDIYIKSARRIDLAHEKGQQQAEALAGFFTKIINGDVPNEFKHFLRQTYLVALEKDPEDKTKLRPLGVPSAIRRIAGIVVLAEYSSTFAEHLLPFNFAVGVGGGCDVIIKTLQLAVDKYITQREKNGDLPSRSLVSLDIRNMFNAVSRERLREIIAEKFPSLEPFADLIYEEAGETFVRLEDGTWTIIVVQEGFSQGCPASPIFAAIVLNEILSVIQKELDSRAMSRLANGDAGDDGKGTLGLILAYVDDTNSMLHHEDVDFFLRRFVELGRPLGADLNIEKTRILTSTSGAKLTETLIKHDDMHMVMRGKMLEGAISTYSTKIVDGTRLPVEVTDGLRVLGAPIGSQHFCHDFLLKMMAKATEDSQKLLDSLEDSQTILRLYSMCTVHKLTHLFSSDVLNAPVENLPPFYYLWESDLANKFSDMTENLICSLTNQHSLPPHSHIIANMSINQGGLGLQHPRANAITAYMLSTKRSLQYSQQGVWLGINKNRYQLPTQITHLYNDWESSDCKAWHIFRKYLSTFSEICFQHADTPNDFVFKASLNGSREKAKDFSSRQMRKNVLFNDLLTPTDVQIALPGVLDKRASMALMTMSRLEDANRMKKDTFDICLKRKLRLKIFNDIEQYVCKCGKELDVYGDHCLGCTANHKTRASNGIRDGIAKVFQKILPIAKMISSGTQVEKEQYGIVKSMPRLQPFDVSIRLDHSLESGAWRVPFSRIGFDVTIVHSTKQPTTNPSEAAKYTIADLRLREGEREKFARRRGSTNTLTKRTLSADQIIGEIMTANNTFIPIAVGPNGEFGSLFRRFLEGDNALQLPSFSSERPNALLAAERAVSSKTPFDILGKADKQWKRTNGNSLFGRNYTSAIPSIWANQQLGLITQTYLANHIKASFSKLRFDPIRQHVTSIENGDDNHDKEDWKFFNGPLNDDIYYDDLHGLQETALTQTDSDVSQSDLIKPDQQATPKVNPRSKGRPKEAATGSTSNAG